MLKGVKMLHVSRAYQPPIQHTKVCYPTFKHLYYCRPHLPGLQQCISHVFNRQKNKSLLNMCRTNNSCLCIKRHLQCLCIQCKLMNLFPFY